MERKTTQREAIVKAFEEAGHALTPAEALAAAKTHLRTLSLPTVYRNLERLRREHRLVAFNLPGKRVAYYELAQAHHHHFICRHCERLFGVDCLAESIRKLLPTGFVLEDHDVQLYGLCPACNRKRRQGKRTTAAAVARKSSLTDAKAQDTIS